MEKTEKQSLFPAAYCASQVSEEEFDAWLKRWMKYYRKEPTIKESFRAGFLMGRARVLRKQIIQAVESGERVTFIRKGVPGKGI
jgi:hypothetical protein